jgi:ribulose-5-phosphate 4-epimerase/fuculose-1-phosphate aldolase
MSNEIDGIIKYNFDFTKTTPLDNTLWEDIEEVRKRLYKQNLIGVYPNGIGFGNISKRVSKNSFVITGTQTGDMESLSSEYYSFVEEFDDSEYYLKSSGMVKPSSEALTHGTIYNLSEEINGVIHIHSLNLWNFMIENEYLVTNDVPYGSREMIQDIKDLYEKSDLKNSKFAMIGHEEGIIVFGKTLKEAEFTLCELIGDFINRVK